MDTDRRQLRSNDPAAAVRIFLARNATEVGIRAAVVSDPSGAVIGGVGAGELRKIAAAGCSLLEARGVAEREQLRRESEIDVTALHVTRLRVGVQRYVVTSVGAPLHATHELGDALARILAA